MIKLKSLINEGRMPKKFFHTTKSENLSSIMSRGLRPLPGGKEWVYLTDEEFTATNYGNMFPQNTKVVMLDIDPRYLDESKLGPDDDDLSDILRQERNHKRWTDLSWEESLRKCSQVTYSGIIPPKAIKFVEEWMV